MKAQKNYMTNPLINFLLIIFQIGFILFTFGIALWILITLIYFFVDGSSIPTNFPVMFELVHEGTLNLPNKTGEHSFLIGHSIGVLGADELPNTFLAPYILIALLANICMLLSMGQVIRILEAVKTGSFLIIENAIRLRWIALLALIIYFLDRLAVIYSASYFSNKLVYPGLEFTSINLFTFENLQSILGALFLLVIAEAFRIGAQLKEENDLTV